MALPGRNEKTLPNNWLLFFYIEQRAFGAEGVPGRAGFPMCRMKRLEHLREGPNTSCMKGANAAVLGSLVHLNCLKVSCFYQRRLG